MASLGVMTLQHAGINGQ